VQVINHLHSQFVKSNPRYLKTVMPDDNATESKRDRKVDVDPALLAELAEVTNDPTQVIDTAIRQWLQRRAIKEADSSRPLTMNPVVPPRGEWND
jgi:hypothetical protein